MSVILIKISYTKKNRNFPKKLQRLFSNKRCMPLNTWYN
jgi:hypothetical protein